MDATTKAIAHVLRQWQESEPALAQVIPFPTVAERKARERERWLHTHTRPMPPSGGHAA